MSPCPIRGMETKMAEMVRKVVINGCMYMFYIKVVVFTILLQAPGIR